MVLVDHYPDNTNKQTLFSYELKNGFEGHWKVLQSSSNVFENSPMEGKLLT